MKTLHEVEPRTPITQADVPFIITQSGSYYLTENIGPVNALDPYIIQIAASNATLDLNGFTITGFFFSIENGALVADDGVQVTLSATGATIRNGSIVSCADAGVDAVDSRGLRLESITSEENGSDGFRMGESAQAINCMARVNGANGFLADHSCSIENSTSRDNAEHGFFLHTGSTATNSTSQSNSLSGFYGFGSNTLSHCTAYNNNEHGFELKAGSVANNCTAELNSIYGFYAIESTMTSCTAISNLTRGFQALGGCVIDNCLAKDSLNEGFFVNYGGTVTNSSAIACQGNGFNLQEGSTIRSSTASLNNGPGFNLNRSTADNCTLFDNYADGFSVSFSKVTNCVAESNNDHGFSVVNWNSTLDSNKARDNGKDGSGYGIFVGGSDTLIVRNHCVANTSGNYWIVAGNNAGAITTTPATAGPWDNFED
jgi:hypothetical protein